MANGMGVPGGGMLFNPYLQMGMGILGGNQGQSGSAAFSNAMRSGLQALNQAMVNQQLYEQMGRERRREEREEEQFRGQQALPGVVAQGIGDPSRGIPGYTPEGYRAAVAAADPAAFAQQAAKQMLTPQQPFEGSGATTEMYNKLLTLRPKIESGEASRLEEATYNIAYRHVSRPQTLTTPAGTYTTPGMDLAGFPMPTDVGPGASAAQQLATAEEVPPVSPMGFQPKAPGESEIRGEANIRNMLALEDSMLEQELEGYDPTSRINQIAGFFSPIRTAQQETYDADKSRWTTGYAATVSGADVPPEQRAQFERENFPQPGEEKETIQTKRLGRLRQIRNEMMARRVPADSPLWADLERLERASSLEDEVSTEGDPAIEELKRSLPPGTRIKRID